MFGYVSWDGCKDFIVINVVQDFYIVSGGQFDGQVVSLVIGGVCQVQLQIIGQLGVELGGEIVYFGCYVVIVFLVYLQFFKLVYYRWEEDDCF